MHSIQNLNKMKTLLQKFLVIALIVSAISLRAQLPGIDGTPYKSMESPVYGTDVLIHGNVGEDQRHTKIVVAANGYLYAAYLVSTGGFRVARSTDNGSSWAISALQGSAYYLNAVDLAVTGADTNTMNVWAVSAGYMKNSIDIWDVTCEKLDQHLNLVTSTIIEQAFSNYGFPDVAIATDFDYPSVGASPFSIGILYSKVLYLSGNNQVIFKSSDDGGNTFTNIQQVASTGHYYINVALAFGRSPSLPEGRYFAAWDQQPAFSYYDSYFGKIYTAHSISQFNGAWSAPYQLDTIGGGFANGAKDPSIACQADQVNNGSNAFSVVVLYTKKLTSSGNHTCAYGAGNINPIAGVPWTSAFTTGTGVIRDIEPDVTYDVSHQKFYATWSDSLTAKLKCSADGMNLQTGGSWVMFYSGYNDGVNISNPFPKVKINPVSQEVVHVWDGDLTAVRTNSTFDKTYLPVGIPEKASQKRLGFNVSPNPCKNRTEISFNHDKEEMVSVDVYDLSGRLVWANPPQETQAGGHRIMVNTNNLNPGCYLVRLKVGAATGFQWIVVMP